MGLIVNADAMATFASDGISTSTVLNMFGVITNVSSAYQTNSNADFTGQTDLSIPDNITGQSVTDWNTAYVAQLTCSAQTQAQKNLLTLYATMVNLFDLTADAPTSRTYIVDQLSATLTAYSITEALQFLTDLQA